MENISFVELRGELICGIRSNIYYDCKYGLKRCENYLKMIILLIKNDINISENIDVSIETIDDILGQPAENRGFIAVGARIF
jgi:hypothetical protein